jgi:enoyl-CoA hydratase
MNSKHEMVFNVLHGHDGDLGEIILNRPAALNALSLDMCCNINNQLIAWSTEKNIKAVLIKSSSDRAFCAGGDIRLLHQHKDLQPEQQVEFFRHEYRLNSTLHHFPKPYIAFLDGITMGGGVGISLHGSHSIGTENLKLAMPESKIGFYPDIGASYLLNKTPGKTGLYLALTGNTIDCHQAYVLGLIQQIIPQNQLDNVQEKLLTSSFSEQPDDTVTDILAGFAMANGTATFSNHHDAIDHCFSQKSIGGIIRALQESSAPWCHQVADDLLKRSSASLKVIFEQLHRAETMTFDEIIQMDFDLTQSFLKAHDFFEGIRAAIIDKDQSPQWQPSSLSEIDENLLSNYFKFKGEKLLTP